MAVHKQIMLQCSGLIDVVVITRCSTLALHDLGRVRTEVTQVAKLGRFPETKFLSDVLGVGDKRLPLRAVLITIVPSELLTPPALRGILLECGLDLVELVSKALSAHLLDFLKDLKPNLRTPPLVFINIKQISDMRRTLRGRMLLLNQVRQHVVITRIALKVGKFFNRLAIMTNE